MTCRVDSLYYTVYSLANSCPVIPKCVIFIGLAYRGAGDGVIVNGDYHWL